MADEPLRRVALRDGVLVIRHTRTDDVLRLQRLFDDLSFDDRYVRFFSGFRPDGEFLDRLAHANEHGACQLLALIEHDDGTEEIAGEAGAWPLPNGNGELGITIAATRRGWLGPYLLDALLEAAATAGMPNLEADVLLTNREMLSLLRARGCAVSGHDGYRSVRVVIGTAGSTPSWAPRDERPRVLVETPGGRWNDEDDVRDQPWQVIACPGPAGRPGRAPCPALVGHTCPLAAGADVIAVRLPGGGTRDALTGAHAELHPGVPVCLHGATARDLRLFSAHGARPTMDDDNGSGGVDDGN